jgi:hypothetical protein
LCILIQQFGFTWNGLSSFDQIQDCDGSPISFEEIIKMSRSCCIERIYDADYELISTERIQKKADELSMGGLGTMALVSCVQYIGMLPRYYAEVNFYVFGILGG